MVDGVGLVFFAGEWVVRSYVLDVLFSVLWRRSPLTTRAVRVWSPRMAAATDRVCGPARNSGTTIMV